MVEVSGMCPCQIPAHPGDQWDVMLHLHPCADLGRDCHYPISVIGEGRKKEGFVMRNDQE